MKIILAFSGGLDTTVIIPWLAETYPGCEITAVCVNLGQSDASEAELKKKASALGAAECLVIDKTGEFAADFLFPMLKAGAVYEKKYLLGTSAARPLIAKVLTDVARERGAEAICHGATGKGNDQIRFELTIKALAPGMKIIAPWRVWTLKSREDEIAYLEKRGIPAPFSKEQSYSRDGNIWHLSHEGLDLEDAWNEPDSKNLLQITNDLSNTPDTPEYVEIGFEGGLPVSVNGKRLTPVQIIRTLNETCAKHGVGVVDLVENRVVGLKSRGVYETPGGALLYRAHADLSALCLDRDQTAFCETVSAKFAELVYAGKWYTPLREALSAFTDKTQSVVTGTVRLKLFKGNIISAGQKSENALYNAGLASFTTGDLFDHADAEGFINLFGLPLTARALMENAKRARTE